MTDVYNNYWHYLVGYFFSLYRQRRLPLPPKISGGVVPPQVPGAQNLSLRLLRYVYLSGPEKRQPQGG